MIKLNLACPCGDCGTREGHLNNRNVRPARLNAERFGFPPGTMICKSCYEAHRYRLRIRLAKEAAMKRATVEQNV